MVGSLFTHQIFGRKPLKDQDARLGAKAGRKRWATAAAA
jgi:hypothetical protein